VQPGNWQNKSSEPVVPLSKMQIDVLRLLAAHRDPESYVAGATPLNRNTGRYSDDIDVFHDREERVAAAALHDVDVLKAAGYRVTWLRQLPLLYTAEVTHGDASTRLEWVVDSDYRFFPTLRDETFGYVLHPVDLAMNKVMAAAGRREVRDLLAAWRGYLGRGGQGARVHPGGVDRRNQAERLLPGSRVACRIDD
jgi:hypothetical protein